MTFQFFPHWKDWEVIGDARLCRAVLLKLDAGDIGTDYLVSVKDIDSITYAVFCLNLHR